MTISGNVTSLSIAEELIQAKIGVLPGTPVWQLLEPNSYSDFGGSIDVVARTPITPDRSRRKGTTTDKNVSGGLNIDLTNTNLFRYLQGLFFASARERATSQSVTGTAAVAMTATTTTTYTAAAGLGAFAANDLVYASGFASLANNGLKLLSAATATTLTTTGNVVEASPPAAAKVETVGKQFASGDLSVTVSSGLATLVSAANAWPTNLVPGSWIYIGGDAAITQFATMPRGWARIRSVTAGAVVLDETILLAGAVPVADAGTTKTIQVFYGHVLKNEDQLANQVRRSYTLERQLGPGVNSNQAEYVQGCVWNEMTLNMPGQDKVNLDATFVGCTTLTKNGTTPNTLLTGTRLNAPNESCFNTSQDYKFGKLSVRPLGSNSTPLFSYAVEANLTVTNNCTQPKALGSVGPIDIQPGVFEVGGSITAYFESTGGIDAVQNNADISFAFGCFSLTQQNGFIFDVPLLQLGDGAPDVEINTDTTVQLEVMGAMSSFGHTLLHQRFAYVPLVAVS